MNSFITKLLVDMEKENPILIDGAQYKLWRDDVYIGEATYVEEDENIGSSFQNIITLEGKEYIEVYIADTWAIVNTETL